MSIVQAVTPALSAAPYALGGEDGGVAELTGGVVGGVVLLLPEVPLFGVVDDVVEPLSTIGSVEFTLVESFDVVDSVVVRGFL